MRKLNLVFLRDGLQAVHAQQIRAAIQTQTTVPLKLVVVFSLTGQSCKDLQCPPYAKCFQTSREGAECRCQFSCDTEERNLICGTDDKTYLNHCVLKMEACRLGKLIKIKSKEGMCSK